MNVYPVPQMRRQPPAVTVRKSRRHVWHQIGLVLIGLVLIWLLATVAALMNKTYTTPISELRSGKVGYCLDNYHNRKLPNSLADVWQCNGSPAQNWLVTAGSVRQPDGYCLAVNSRNRVVVQICHKTAAQQWSRDGGGLRNAANHLCLDVPGGLSGRQLVTSLCGNLASVNLSWTVSTWRGSLLSISSPPCRQRVLGQRVACYAQRQWLAWETEPALHRSLLNAYTDGNAYEEWCADFVSYVYAESGAPFINGERAGWDEYNANNIQYMGFIKHPANSGYIPQPGDVAYFNYTGGHVEIVVAGGRHPEFIYGDSGTIDPLTGNGTMAKNGLTSDGSAGQVQYYLSPL